MQRARRTRLAARKDPEASIPPLSRGPAPLPAPFIARRLGRRAGVRLRRVGRGVDLEPRWANVRLDSLLPGSVGDHLLECGIHFAAQLGVAELQANAVSLGREWFTDNLELARVLRLCREAGQDHIVGGYRVHSATNER